MSVSSEFRATDKDARVGPLGITPARAMELLNELRDRLADGAASSYAQNLKQVKNDMAQLARRANEPARRELYNAGYALMANGGMGLLRRFRDVYTNDCDHAIARLSGRDVDVWAGAGELSLVDSHEFERDLAIGRLSAKATYQCSQQLTALDRRVGALLNLKRMDAEGNPFAIKRVFAAFVKAAEANWAGETLSLILLETFEHYTAGELPAVYQGLNEYLVQQGVLAKLPVEREQREHELTRRKRIADLDDGIGDIFVRLASRLMAAGRGGQLGAGDNPGRAGDGVPATGGDTTPVLSADPGAASAQGGPMAFGQLLDGLTGLQRGSGQAAARLGVDIGEFDPTSSAMLRSLAASPLLRWMQPTDAMTVELIAMLFECIFSDADVPDALRGELGRLQVPILKVALMNKGFFGDQRHPARRLIDLVAAALHGWNAEDETDLLGQIQCAISNVLDGFDDDTEVFSAQIDNLERLLQNADRRGHENVSDLVRRLEQRDRKAVVATVIEDQIARRLRDHRLPDLVRVFIDDLWRELLSRVYVEHGEAADIWQQALCTLDDLIWSVQPKTGPDERKRLMAMLPVLLRRLPEGVALVGRDDEWDPFLQALMKLHMEAIKPRRQPVEGVDPVRSAAEVVGSPEVPGETPPRPAVGDIEPDSELAASLADVDGVSDGVDGMARTETGPGSPPRGETEPGAEPADELLEAAWRIELGDWVEFSDLGGQQLTLRASWMSRLDGLILFADRQGRHAQVLTREGVGKLLKGANARVLSREPLTDRVVAKLLVGGGPDAAPPT